MAKTQQKQLRSILRFCDLKSRALVSNYAQLAVLIRDHGFPPMSFMTSAIVERTVSFGIGFSWWRLKVLKDHRV